jgi:hypothetical protein
MLVVLAAFSFVLRHGSRWFVPVLLMQCALIAAAGERAPVIIAAITLIVLLAHANDRPRGRQVLMASVIDVVHD